MLLNYCLKQDKDQTKLTRNILEDFYNNLKESINIVSKINIKDSRKVENILSKKDIPKSKEFDYIIEPIRLHILDKNISNFKTVYTFQKLFGKNIKIYFISTKLNLKKLDKYIYMILCWLCFITKYNINKNVAQKLTLYVYFTKKLKILPDKYATIEKEHINTGFAITCVENSEIIIYRKEEWFKVFIHETFHSLGLDFSCNKINESTDYILNLFKVKSKVNLYEAYTDTWAKIMNVVVCSYFLNKDLENFINDVNILMNLEMAFSIFQTVKILNHMGLTYKDIISDDKVKLQLYKEKTNMLSYYVISSILLNNYEDFFKWCTVNNTNILQFDNTNSIYRQLEFCKLINSKYKSKLFLKRINEIQKILPEVNDPYLFKNMRKSLCEIEI